MYIQDPEGLIFGNVIGNDVIKLYDLRCFGKGPFSTFNIGCKDTGFEWTGMKFSPDGKSILIMTNGPIMRMESGRLVHTLQTDHPNTIEQVTFNPKYFMLASACKQLKFWIPSIDELIRFGIF
uniref:Uncharacterized protein n=1 Tax=Meloidogyne floridensis TaxID=298350 RepID=A0A915NH14_9BILA